MGYIMNLQQRSDLQEAKPGLSPGVLNNQKNVGFAWEATN